MATVTMNPLTVHSWADQVRGTQPDLTAAKGKLDDALDASSAALSGYRSAARMSNFHETWWDVIAGFGFTAIEIGINLDASAAVVDAADHSGAVDLSGKGIPVTADITSHGGSWVEGGM